MARQVKLKVRVGLGLTVPNASGAMRNPRLANKGSEEFESKTAGGASIIEKKSQGVDRRSEKSGSDKDSVFPEV